MNERMRFDPAEAEQAGTADASNLIAAIGPTQDDATSNVIFHFPVASVQHIDAEIADIERILSRQREAMAPLIDELNKFVAMRRVAVRLEAKQ